MKDNAHGYLERHLDIGIKSVDCDDRASVARVTPDHCGTGEWLSLCMDSLVEHSQLPSRLQYLLSGSSQCCIDVTSLWARCNRAVRCIASSTHYGGRKSERPRGWI